MNQNTRFYALVACVLVVVAGLFYFVRGNGKPGPEAQTTSAPKSEASGERDNLDAPEITSSHRESRLTATSARSSARDDEPKRGPRVGDNAIRGEVTLEEDNMPIDGAEISIYWMDPDAATPTYDEESVWKSVTNARGLYRIDKLPKGRFAVIAKKDELAGVSSVLIKQLVFEPDDHVADIQMTNNNGRSRARWLRSAAARVANAISLAATIKRRAPLTAPLRWSVCAKANGRSRPRQKALRLRNSSKYPLTASRSNLC